MDTTIIQLMSSGGLVVVGAYLVYYVVKRHSYLQEFINNKLVTVVENNTKVMENLTGVINEMRHEIKEELKNIRERINN